MRPSGDLAFVARLEQISAKFPSRAALAKAANIPPSSLQAYFEGAEPTRPVLVALAHAARVSIEWLAEGRGYREPHPPVPDDYVEVPFYDVLRSGGYIYPLTTGEIAEFIYLKLAWLSYNGMSASDLIVIQATQSLVPGIHEQDIVVVDTWWRTKFVAPTPQIPPGIYLISQQAKLSIREVLRVSGDEVELRSRGEKGKMRLHIGDNGFAIHGRVIWHARSLPTPEKPKT